MKFEPNAPKRPHQRIMEFCEEFSVSRAYVEKQIRNGKLKAFKLGKATILDGQSVSDLLAAGGYYKNGQAA